MIVIPIKKYGKNPRAGKKEFYVPGITKHEYVSNTEYIEYEKFLTSKSIAGIFQYSSPHPIHIIYPHLISYDVQIDLHKICVLTPEPEYIIQYDKDYIVECRFCKQTQKFSELYHEIEETQYDFGEDSCIHCAKSRCVTYKYETIEQAKERGLECCILQ